MKNNNIERNLITWGIVSTEYLSKTELNWHSNYIKSDIARTISNWIWEYYKQYNESPKANIEHLYFSKITEISEEDASFIEIVLQGLSEDFGLVDFNLDYAITETNKYFQQRKVEIVKENLDPSNPEESEKVILDYEPLQKEHKINSVDLFEKNKENKERIKEAFTEQNTPLIEFQGDLGKFLNKHMVQGGFVSYIGREKIGKTQILTANLIQSLKCGNDTLYINCGDLTRNQFIRRLGVALSGKSDLEEYCGEMYVPEKDCIFNQIDECTNSARIGNFGICLNIEELSTYEGLVEKANEFPDYIPCRNCSNFRGNTILRKVPAVTPLTWQEAYRNFIKFREEYPAKFKLETHPADTLTVKGLKRKLKEYKKKEGFVPKVIIIDYYDILACSSATAHMQHNLRVNEKWLKLRSLSGDSEYGEPLIIGATQADADSYDKDLVTKKNFTGSKGIHSHVTFMAGLNKTPEEEEIGIMRLNPIDVREGKGNVTTCVKILQRLEQGKAIIDSFF